MAAHVTTMTMTTHAIVHMASRAKIVPTMSIGVHRIHAKMVHHARSARIHLNVIVHLAGRVNCVTLKWYPVQMLPNEKASIQNISVTMDPARTLATHIDAIVNKVIPDRIARRRSTNVKVVVSINLLAILSSNNGLCYI